MNSKGGASRGKAGFGDEQNGAQYNVLSVEEPLNQLAPDYHPNLPARVLRACLQRVRSPERENSGFSELNLEVK
jgi:hypothetical protein